jgi:Cu2+-exporting ATPase
MSVIHDKPLIQEVAAKADQSAACKHCGLPIASKSAGGFCCHGCQLAYDLIQQLNLTDFYRLQAQSARPLPQPDRQQRQVLYDLYDHPEFQAAFCETQPDGRRLAHLYVDHLSCYACVWVCERAIGQLDETLRISVNLASGQALIEFEPDKVALSDVVARFEQLGYPVSPNRHHGRQDRRDLSRIAISGFCFMNIMLLAVAEYTNPDSLSGGFETLFRWLQLGLASICLVFAAAPFYRGTWQALRRRQIHLDIPITLAILAAFGYSTFHVLKGSGPIYYDSLTAIVFLLLSGRFVQKKALLKHLRGTALERHQETDFVRRQRDHGEWELVPVSRIVAGDRLRIMPGHPVPVKARLLSDPVSISYEHLTGEPDAFGVQAQQVMRAGALCTDEVIEVAACEDGAQSYLQRLRVASQRLKEGKSRLASLSQTLSRALILVVLTVACGVLIWQWPQSPQVAMDRFVAILLIACPCAFGLGIPLILARAFDLGLKADVLWNHPRALERLAAVKTFFFDKTGTLTQTAGELQMLSWAWPGGGEPGDEAAFQGMLQGLDQLNDHHVIRLLAKWAREEAPGEPGTDPGGVVQQFKVETGQGVSFIWQGHDIRIGRPGYCCRDHDAAARSTRNSESWLSLDGCLVGRFALSETVREDARQLLQNLQGEGVKTAILSGDGDRRVQSLIHDFSLVGLEGQGGLSPVAKTRLLQQAMRQGAAMVGNGLNDSPALAQAAIGIAVHGSQPMAQQQADMVLLSDRLTSIHEARRISGRCRRAIIRCFGFSASFNVLGMSLGAAGLISPVLAAILMPLSSLTVILLATRW